MATSEQPLGRREDRWIKHETLPLRDLESQHGNSEVTKHATHPLSIDMDDIDENKESL